MQQLNVNDTLRSVAAEPGPPLPWVIREQLGLTGTQYGRGMALCGACSMHINGVAVRSCARPLSSLEVGSKVVTIEGLSAKGRHPLQKAWVAPDVPQCGFCQSGMLMATGLHIQHADGSSTWARPGATS